ncbi:TolC family protein [Dyadobacter psychrophilus]|uniref:Outer membrane protein TolC n=1 Tax=Dyadobacter psychrophilus TaxID=651661 RepID=A0A1T5DYS9_9BACT|nr:TolC family protein [Dyadobacter psychrophilus]SKB76871.1 Outer membrane protein TolC [Dyadobacter psychrophilus]
MKRFVIQLTVLVGTWIFKPAIAQDSANTLRAEQVLELVRAFHPVAKQAAIQVGQAEADLVTARGGFDPVLGAYVARKRFGGTNYYNRVSPEITIPTWYGLEIHSGIENYTGERLDPTMTKGQSAYVGVSIPLAKDLLMDKRRAALKQARIFRTLADTEQRLVLNDLLMNAMDAYWQWVSTYNQYQLMQANVDINQQRLDFVRKSLMNGERAAIDTIETLAQLQSFQYQQNQLRVEFRNAGLQLSAFLWTAIGEPYNLPETIVPPADWDNEQITKDFDLDLASLLSTTQQSHPELQAYDFKLRALDIEKKLKFQQLLPKADFRYNHLSKGYNAFASVPESPIFDNNYQYGFKFEIPMRLSAGRGEYKKTKLKIEESQLAQMQKRLELQVKIRQYHNDLVNLREQIKLQNLNLGNYLQLVKAEEIRFRNGESSLFLINSRENKAIEARQKLIELKAKYFKAIYGLQWSAGLLN